jgi:hypothetical protein
LQHLRQLGDIAGDPSRSALSKNGDGIRQSTELADLRRHGKGEGNGRLEKTDQSNR